MREDLLRAGATIAMSGWSVGYEGEINFQLDRPDGTLRKLLDVSRINSLGWKSKISLEKGLNETHNWYDQQDPADLRL